MAAPDLLEANAAMWAVVLAGGIGARFWPLSGPKRPKQLLHLLGDVPMITQCVDRLAPLIPPERVLVVTSADIAEAIRSAIPGVPPMNVLVEPKPLGTAAAIALAADAVMRRAGPDTVICAMPADIAAAFAEGFRDTIRVAGALVAREDAIATIGARPVRPETGFGYAVPGAPLAADHPVAGGGPAWVTRFVEKPTAKDAERLVADGAWWHTGISLWRPRVMLDALQSRAPEIGDALGFLAERDLDRFFGAVRSVSLERGLFERGVPLVLVPGDFGWDDVGTWASLRRASELDDDGNGARGAVHFVDASGNIVHAEHGDVVVYGVDNLLVVTVDGVTLVTSVDRATDLRPLLDRLPLDVRMGRD
jgi:mannose-1-phosphate guanylyltransferase